MQQPADPLGVRAGARFAIERSRAVRIDDLAVQGVARTITAKNESPDPSEWETQHLGDIRLDDRQLANFVLVLDALNFCFWGDPRWHVTFNGHVENGYWALTMALRRALAEGYPITEAGYLSQIPSRDVAQILRGESIIPLFAARVHNLREAGQALLREQNGEFLNCITSANCSAPELLKSVIALFPSFVDVRVYRGRTLPFYKRAQILVSDLSGAFASREQVIFKDLSFLTAFADYKVPQVLHQLGVLRYSAELETLLSDGQIIPEGAPEEVEIRAATILAVERIAAATGVFGARLPDYAVDWRLWELGQQNATDRLPYHRTPTIAY